MSRFINKALPDDEIIIYNSSDWHTGSRAFHKEAAKAIVERVGDEKAYLTFGGDAIEGKTVDSPHFNPSSLNDGETIIDAQMRSFVEMLKPIRDRVLLIQTGNHELYLSKNINIVRIMCEMLGRPEIQGDYQTWLKLNGVTMHFWDGRPSLPRGAKDPIQREANQKAWLKNKLAPLSGSSHAQYMAHTHACMIVSPIDQYALLNSGADVKGKSFREQPRDVNGDEWVPPDARWYVNTGTLRRSGGFGYEDYAEIAGFPPMPIACTKTIIREDRIRDIQKIIL